MAQPIPIEWQGMKRLATVEALIRRESARLAGWAGSLTVWKVTIEASALRGSTWDPVRVRIEVRGPQRQMIVNRSHEDPGIAVRDALADVFRKLERRALRDRRAGSTRAKVALAA